MTGAGVSCIPGYHGKNQDPDFLAGKAQKIGYPIMIKAVLGGGGKVCEHFKIYIKFFVTGNACCFWS